VPRILDLYCGMGGLSLGFVLALEDAEVLGLDIDRYAIDTYNYNLGRFGAKAVVQDVLKWEPSGEYDVIMGGSPCQPFSLANTKKRGKDHPLYPTFPRFFDIILELKPKVFLLENVKGLTTKRHRPLLDEQLRRVEPYYKIRFQVLNAAYYGVPQRRERLFVLGIRRDLGKIPSFPSPTHAEKEQATLHGKLHRWVTVREAIGDLLAIPPTQYPKKLIQTNPRHGKPIDMDKPSRVVKVDGRGGDFTFDTMLIPLTPAQVERIRREREDTSRHLAKMEFPDNLDKPSRTISSHTVEGTKRETIVLPIVTEHVMTEKGGWSNPRSDWGSRVMPEDKPSFTITEKHRSGQLVRVPSEHEVRVYSMEFSSKSLSKHKPQELDRPSSTIRASFHKIPPDATIRVPPTTKEAMNKPSPVLVADARIYATGRREHGTDVEKGCYRRLTVRECLRLQSFPDWWGFPNYISISRKYKLVGEAVPPILAYRIAVHIGKLIGWEVREPPKAEEWQLPYFRRAFADYFG